MGYDDDGIGQLLIRESPICQASRNIVWGYIRLGLGCCSWDAGWNSWVRLNYRAGLRRWRYKDGGCGVTGRGEEV